MNLLYVLFPLMVSEYSENLTAIYLYKSQSVFTVRQRKLETSTSLSGDGSIKYII